MGVIPFHNYRHFQFTVKTLGKPTPFLLWGAGSHVASPLNMPSGTSNCWLSKSHFSRYWRPPFYPSHTCNSSTKRWWILVVICFYRLVKINASTRGNFFIGKSIWQTLETLLVVRAGRGSPAGLEWVESPESAGHPRAHRGPPAWPLQSSMLRRSGEPWCASPSFPRAFYLFLPSVSSTFSLQLAPWNLISSTWTFP